MAEVQNILGDVRISGNLTVTGRATVSSGMSRDNLDTIFGTIIPIELPNWRIWDAFQTNLTTAAADDLGIATGTFGTNFPYISSGDLNAAGALTRRARAVITMPHEYFPTVGNMRVRLVAGMLNAVASVSCTADVEMFVSNGSTGVSGGDKITTAAQSINSLTFAVYDFVVDNSGIEEGDYLDIRLTLAPNSVTASSHFAVVLNTQLYIPTKP